MPHPLGSGVLVLRAMTARRLQQSGYTPTGSEAKQNIMFPEILRPLLRVSEAQGNVVKACHDLTSLPACMQAVQGEVEEQDPETPPHTRAC